jgi:hypothetical protein
MDFSNPNNFRLLLLAIGLILAGLFPRYSVVFRRLRWLLVAVIILAGIYPAKTRQLYDELVSKFSPASTPGTAADAGASQAASSSQSAASANADDMAQTEAAVQAYMRKWTPPQSNVSYLNWSDFSTSGPASAITLRYQVHKPMGDDVFAAVRFTVQDGSVAKSQVIQTGLDSAIIPAPQPRLPRLPARPAPVVDHFSGSIFAATHGPSMTIELNDAFSLAQLDQAKAKAQAEKKPLGFLMVWGQFFGHEADPRGQGSTEALVHFYEVFNSHLVLVFVRHETELGLVPAAVAQGFRGPDEGGYAPNMAVTDATCTEFIVEIPFKDLPGPGRDQLFAQGAAKIDQWLATHPDAVPTPAPAASP